MAERKTNTEFVTELMEYSPYGALVQVFILTALESFSKVVIEEPPLDHPLISGEAWKGVAQDVLQKLHARYEEDRSHDHH